MIRSPIVLGPVVSKPEIADLKDVADLDAPIRELERKINVRRRGGSELFEISFQGTVPEEAARLVNAVVDEYFALLERRKNDAVDKSLFAPRNQAHVRLLEYYMLKDMSVQISSKLGIPIDAVALMAFPPVVRY